MHAEDVFKLKTFSTHYEELYIVNMYMLLTTLAYCVLSIKTLSSFFIAFVAVSLNSYKRQSKNFQRFHNKHHRYSCLKGKTPLEVLRANNFEPLTIAPGTKLPQLDYVPDGEIVLIRFIRSNCKLDIFGEKFQVSKNLAYSYVKAVIVTSIQTLQVYRDSELVETFDYRLTSNI